MKRNTMTIKNTQIDVSSIESIKTTNYKVYCGHIYQLEIIMKSGYIHLFDFDSENERDTYYNELIQKWINV